MGLNFHNSEAEWSYGGFHRFRTRLAKEIGIDFEKAVDEGINNNEDPIVILLNHSDCDGEMSPDECRAVAPRIRELMKDWPDDYDKKNGALLADGMDYCAESNVHLGFG